MNTAQRDQRLAETFVALSGTLVDDFDVLDFLTLLAERAAELLDVTAAGVILSDQRGGWHPTAASSEDAQLLELLATQTHEGPCQECIRTGSPVTSADLSREDERWHTFTEAAMARGFQAAAAVPIRMRREPVGALTLLNTESVPVDDESLRWGQALADVAIVGILNHQTARRDELVSEQLQATLHHRVVVEQAKGVLAETGQVGMREAFDLLRDYARSNGQRLTDLARSVADGTLEPMSLAARTADGSKGTTADFSPGE